MRLLLLLLSVLWLSPARAHHVLCVFPVPSPSHDHIGKGVVEALLDAGHKVTWGTPFPNKPARKNLRYIDLSATVKLNRDIDIMRPEFRQEGLSFVKEFSRNVSSVAMRSQELRAALVGERFDAVVTEWFLSNVDTGYAAVQQAPWILLSGTPIHPHLEMLVDDVRSIPTHPLMINHFPVPMTLWQRLVNTAMMAFMTSDYFLSFSSEEAFYVENFGPLASARGVSLPPYASALHNVSILLVNSHPSIVMPQSLPPHVVDIAGYHIDQNPAPLPKDLQDLLDSSPQGVVYFSMGSVIKSSSLPESTQQAILRVLGGIPQTVLWKFEAELKNVPRNVHVRKWMPQASILAHQNVKVFITHGGLLSMLEAAYYGVPLLAIPVFGDQPSNAHRAQQLGVARRVDFSEHMAGEVKVELTEMLTNDSYSQKSKEVSKLFRKRVVPPSKLISYYIELAIESNGAFHLRPPTKLYAWYQRWMLDQLAVVLLVLYVLCTVVRKTFGFLKNKLVKSKKVKRS